MLKREENELICRVGPDTPMGNVLRRFWHPACLSAELVGPDSDPLRLRLLGEQFVAFRDTNGEVGILDELCMHRGASLALGRVEDCGIRCLYHGWKFAVDGTIQETPNHADPAFRARFHAPAYPVREEAGLVWVYLGPRHKQPSFPRLPLMEVPESNRANAVAMFEANWVQVMEGVLDSSHLGILHQDALRTGRPDGIARRDQTQFLRDYTAPRIEARRTTFGLHYAALRTGAELNGQTQVRITAYLAPNRISIAPGNATLFAVPVDDGATRLFNCFFERDQRIGEEPLRSQSLRFLGLSDDILDGFGASPKTFGGPDRATRDNNYLQDRIAMRRGETFSGLPNFTPEDIAVTGSMGPIYDRSKEVLVTADHGVNGMRRILVESCWRVEEGGEPIGLDPGVDTLKVRAAAGLLEAGQPWQSLVPDHVEVRHEADADEHVVEAR